MAKGLKRVALFGLLAALVLGLGVMTALPASAEAQAPVGPMQRFIAKLAANLGIGEEQLRAAVKTTQLQPMDEAIAEGRTKQEQAERARQRVEQGRGFSFGPAEFARPPWAGPERMEQERGFGFGPAVGGPRLPGEWQLGHMEQGRSFGPSFGGPRHRGERQRGPQAAYGVRNAGFQAVALVLGLAPSQLRDELRGKTLAEVGQARGKSREQVGQAYLQGVRDALDRSVANGRLAREQADRMIERVQQSLNTLLDRRWPERRSP